MAGKKRKLPRDLSEAEVLVRTEKLSISTITAARASLSEVTLSDIGVAPLRSLSPEEFMAWLVARFGVKESKKICSVAASIPPTLTSAQRDRYIQKHLGSGPSTEATSVCSLVSEECCSLTDLQVSNSTSLPQLILAPPVKQCLRCDGNLVENHHCVVKVYRMTSFMEADKVTLRCRKCRITYNYAMWGDKHTNGFIYYGTPREFVEVTDTAYMDRKLLELQCSLA